MENIELSIIIVSYNTCKMTLECVSSLLRNTKLKNFEVIIIDNNSTDDSVNQIAKSFPDIKLIASNVNLGFAEGNNYCAKLARGKLLLLLNPDTIVLENSVDNLVKFSYQIPNAGIWGGRTLFSNMSLNMSSCWNRMTLWSLFCNACGLSLIFPNSFILNTEAIGGWARDSVRRVDIVSGCFFLIKKSIWDDLNGFDSRFFMYGEEADLCLRAKKLGYQPIITNSAEIIHYGGASENRQSEKLIKLLKAKVQLINNHWNSSIKKIGVFLLMLWPLGRLMAYRIISLCYKNTRIREKYIVWKDVWLDRKLWIKGYY